MEFGIESLIMPWININYVSCMGVLLCMIGEFIRKVAMWHAASAFTHQIAYRKNKNHSLITDGIYGILNFEALTTFQVISVILDIWGGSFGRSAPS